MSKDTRPSPRRLALDAFACLYEVMKAAGLSASDMQHRLGRPGKEDFDRWEEDPGEIRLGDYLLCANEATLSVYGEVAALADPDFKPADRPGEVAPFDYPDVVAEPGSKRGKVHDLEAAANGLMEIVSRMLVLLVHQHELPAPGWMEKLERLRGKLEEETRGVN